MSITSLLPFEVLLMLPVLLSLLRASYAVRFQLLPCFLLLFAYPYLCSAVEDLRYQHTYHPIPIEKKCPALAHVLDQVSAGLFGDSGVYEPLLNTIRQGDYYLLSDDFDSCVLFFILP